MRRQARFPNSKIVNSLFGEPMSEAVQDFEDSARSFTRHHIVQGAMPPEDVRAAWSDLRKLRRAAGSDWELERGRGKPTMRPRAARQARRGG